jgi:hypothetical protein
MEKMIDLNSLADAQHQAGELAQAVVGLREAGHQELIARGLFARAFFY